MVGVVSGNINGSDTLIRLTHEYSLHRDERVHIKVSGRPDAITDATNETIYDVVFAKTGQPRHRISGEVVNGDDIHELLTSLERIEVNKN